MVYTTWRSIARARSGCQPLDLRQSVLDTRLVRSARRGTRRAKERQRPEGGGVVGAGVVSVVYPLARGSAPDLLLVWSFLLLGERPTVGGIVGILLIAVGLYAIGLPNLRAWRELLRALRQIGPHWALLAGLCISLYTVVDRVGVQRLDPLIYLYVVIWITLILITPVTIRAVGWKGLRAEWQASRFNNAIAGFTTMAAYATVLYAIRAGTPASYAGSIREVSIVLGVVVGVVFLKEKGTAMRFVGAVCVTAGVVMIKLLG